MPDSWEQLVAVLKEDFRRHDRKVWSAGFQALAVHRLGNWARARRDLAGAVGRVAHSALFVFVRNVYGIELPVTAVIGRRVEIGHQHGIVLHEHAVIGDECVLRHNVTIGVGVYAKRAESPVLGRGVKVGPGVVIIGGVHVGDGARLGPNALVTTDVPAGAMVFERPTRIVQLQRAPEPVPADQGAEPGVERAAARRDRG